MTRKELITYLESSYDLDEELAVSIWSKREVVSLIAEFNEKREAEGQPTVNLTEQQITRILQKAGNYDAEIGINWDSLKSLVNDEINKS